MDQKHGGALIRQECAFRIDTHGGGVEGKTKMTLREKHGDTLRVNTRKTIISSVTVNGEAAEYTHRDPETLLAEYTQLVSGEIVLPVETLEKKTEKLRHKKQAGTNEDCELEISLQSVPHSASFEVTISFALTQQSTVHIEQKDTCAFFSYPLLQSNAAWLPCLDALDALCTWSLTYTVAGPFPKDFSVISSGTLAGKEEHSDTRTYCYTVETPTHASQIQFVGGAFCPHSVDSAFYFPHAKNTPGLRAAEFYARVCSFFEWYFQQPQGKHAVVFVEAPTAAFYGKGIAVLSANTLYGARTIDQQLETQDQLLLCAALQWAKGSALDWGVHGAALYAASVARRHFFGKNTATYTVCEQQHWLGTLHPHEHLAIKDTETLGASLSEKQQKIVATKAFLLFVSLEAKTGQNALQKALAHATEHTLGAVCDQLEATAGSSHHRNVAQWAGFRANPSLRVVASYDKKKNTVEIEIRQMLQNEAHQPVNSPMKIRVYEQHDIYDHIVFVAGKTTKAALPVHTKTKRQKKKEAEPQEPETDAQTPPPVCFVVADPEHEWPASVEMAQPRQMWLAQLTEERRDIAAQYSALVWCAEKGGVETVDSLENTIENQKTFYKIRVYACSVLGRHSSEENNFIGTARLLSLFYKRFCVQTPNRMFVVKRNSFDDIATYFVQKEIPRALLGINTETVPQLIEQFYLMLLRYNNNTNNRLSDCFYVASLIENCAECLQRNAGREIPSLDKTLALYRKLEKITPSFNGRIGEEIFRCAEYSGERSRAPPKTPRQLETRLALSHTLEDAVEVVAKYRKEFFVGEHLTETVAGLLGRKYKTVPLFLPGALGLFARASTKTEKKHSIGEESWMDEMAQDEPLRNILGEDEEKEKLKTALLEILARITSRPEASPFLHPVRNIAGYSLVVKNPMDLGTVYRKCLDGKYKTVDSFSDDVLLVFENCFRFNHSAALICHYAKFLSLLFRGEVQRLPGRTKLVLKHTPDFKIKLCFSHPLENKQPE
ncbi:MAG: TATA-binding protein associated factor Taf2 [Amphiamblys sp. WSBS2006]|nr:MAG: TATA-binding protein associated factor Taf2 [Amphiamblys sp. WSBS2006]